MYISHHSVQACALLINAAFEDPQRRGDKGKEGVEEVVEGSAAECDLGCGEGNKSGAETREENKQPCEGLADPITSHRVRFAPVIEPESLESPDLPGGTAYVNAAVKEPLIPFKGIEVAVCEREGFDFDGALVLDGAGAFEGVRERAGGRKELL
jgi:hypothetical protein